VREQATGIERDISLDPTTLKARMIAWNNARNSQK
jgi:hypothetical protein